LQIFLTFDLFAANQHLLIVRTRFGRLPSVWIGWNSK